MHLKSDSNCMAPAVPGCVVEFMQGDRPQLAWVLEEQNSRLRLLTINRREIKLPAARILAWTGPLHRGEHSREQIMEALNARQERRQELERIIDPMEIWELAQGEVEKASLRWFAELIWDREQAGNIDALAAMGRVMLECKTHFKFQPPDFIIHPREKVEIRLRERDALLERERLSGMGRDFFDKLWQTRNSKAPAPALGDPELEERLKQLLLTRIANPEDQESEQVWKLVHKGLPEIPNLELQLAQLWGILHPHHNYLYDQADYAPGDAWSAAHQADIQALEQRVQEAREEPEPVPFISVDSETTRDVDDAFHLEPRVEGGWLLRLALARPTLGWALDAPLGRAVAQRATSVYLPEGDSHMLPEALGLELFSLLQERERPALVLELILADDASGSVTLQGCTPKLAWVRVGENVSYNAAEAAIQADIAGEETAHGVMLAQAWQLAERLRQARLEQGAVIIERPEPEIVLRGEGGETQVDFEAKPETPRAQLLVSEFMILVNSAVALWARERGLPLLHRTQDIALPKTAFGVWSAPHEVHQVVKNLTSAVLEPAPRPHASLGVPAYSPISSPLRRYSDFLNMLQVQCLLEGQEPQFDQAGLESLLPFLSTRLELVGRIQRFRPRYWKLLYFKQQGRDALHEAIVVDEGPQFVFLSLPREQLFVRGPRGLFSEKLVPGQRLCIRLGKIDPLNNEVHVLEALEDESCAPSDIVGR